jgi:hypothetical protein
MKDAEQLYLFSWILKSLLNVFVLKSDDNYVSVPVYSLKYSAQLQRLDLLLNTFITRIV